MTLSDSIRQDRTSLQERKDSMRAKIEADIDAFFGAGNEITEVPIGMTAESRERDQQSMRDYWAAQTQLRQEMKK